MPGKLGFVGVVLQASSQHPTRAVRDERRFIILCENACVFVYYCRTFVAENGNGRSKDHGLFILQRNRLFTFFGSTHMSHITTGFPKPDRLGECQERFAQFLGDLPKPHFLAESGRRKHSGWEFSRNSFSRGRENTAVGKSVLANFRHAPESSGSKKQ